MFPGSLFERSRFSPGLSPSPVLQAGSSTHSYWRVPGSHYHYHSDVSSAHARKEQNESTIDLKFVELTADVLEIFLMSKCKVGDSRTYDTPFVSYMQVSATPSSTGEARAPEILVQEVGEIQSVNSKLIFCWLHIIIALLSTHWDALSLPCSLVSSSHCIVVHKTNKTTSIDYACPEM